MPKYDDFELDIQKLEVEKVSEVVHGSMNTCRLCSRQCNSREAVCRTSERFC